jgi:hypothetical protein
MWGEHKWDYRREFLCGTDLNGRRHNLSARFRYKSESKALGDLEHQAPREHCALLWSDLSTAPSAGKNFLSSLTKTAQIQMQSMAAFPAE